MLEDTSFAIHPGQEQKILNADYKELGGITSVSKMESGAVLKSATGDLFIKFYREDIVRFVINPFGETSLKSSPALTTTGDKVEVSVTESGKDVKIKSKLLTVLVEKYPVRVTVKDSNGNILTKQSSKGMGYKESKEVLCYTEMGEEDHFYGFGEKTGFLDKRGEKMVMWNTDVYAPHNPETDSLYQSIPYFMTLKSGLAFGTFFDNTFKTTFDLRSESDHYSFKAEGGQIDYYIMAGPSPKDVLEQYTFLTGRMPIPPKWAIGYHQSRYSYETEQEVRELAKNFKEKQIPLDVIYLDIHYMDEYRVFTFDKDKFPNPKQMIADLKEMGIRIVPIVDPGVKQDAEYKIYQEGIYEDHFCKYIEGDYFFGDVWPGKSAFPDFTNSKAREWWGEKHKYYTDLGIEGVWNDMNEPSVFNESKTMDLNVMHENDGDPRTHRELHNIYGFMMGKSTYEGMKKQLGGKRPFLLTRAGYSGIQRYATVWTGDNRSFWEHLQLSIPMVLNLGLSGIPFAGPDVGGFAHDSNGELLARWTQVGAFTPYFRNHCAIGFARQEPWSFGDKYEKVIKKYIELRYQWLPHLYSLFAEAHRTGTPIMRPLMLEYPNDPETYNLYDQFMVGDSVIVAPILQPSAQHRVVYLPAGTWTDYWTGDVLEGKKHHLVKADLETLPMFIKQGSLIVNGDVKQSTEVEDHKVSLHLYYGDQTESTFKWYEDDGSTFDYQNDNYSLTTLNISCSEKEIKIQTSKEGTYTSKISKVELIVHGAEDEVKVSLDGKELNVEKNRANLSL